MKSLLVALVSLVLLVLLVPGVANAERRKNTLPEDFACAHCGRRLPEQPCTNAVVDPIVTPVRDVYLDAQRSACLRTELSVGLLGHALIDTPGFHGVLGGDLALGGRLVVAKAHEFSAQLRLVDYSFVQNAVNKVTNTGFGPLVLGAAANGSIGDGARAALVFQVELPYTRDEMDTTRVSGQLAGVMSGRLSRRVVLHARLGALGMVASSLGGSTNRLAFRAGADLAWQFRGIVGHRGALVYARLALHAGAEAMAGWDHGFDHLLLRAGVHMRPGGGAWRLRIGAGVPVGGAERTNAILDLGVVRDLD